MKYKKPFYNESSVTQMLDLRAPDGYCRVKTCVLSILG